HHFDVSSLYLNIRKPRNMPSTWTVRVSPCPVRGNQEKAVSMNSHSTQLTRSKNKILKKDRKTKSRLMKYFTKALLQEAARTAEQWDFNRQLDLDAINALPDLRFPVSSAMPHH